MILSLTIYPPDGPNRTFDVASPEWKQIEEDPGRGRVTVTNALGDQLTFANMPYAIKETKTNLNVRSAH
jgi:hypothetical protein